MSKVKRYLKPAWVHRLFELTQSLLPAGSSAALLLNGKRLVEINGHDLVEGASGVYGFPLLLKEERVGVLLLRLASGSSQNWGELLAHALQGMLESEHTRRSVAKETLASYHEIASLQRAVTGLNDSLKPAAVVDALLKQYEGQHADFGAVYLLG